MPSIAEVLDINLDMIPQMEVEALTILERVWEEFGRTMDSKQLERVIGGAMDECGAMGTRYPAVFLLRKGQLHRGQFRPQSQHLAATHQPVGFVVPKCSD